MTRTALIALAAVIGLALAGLVSAGLVSAWAGGFDCSRFEKNGDGTWGALQATEIGGPGGRVDFTPGEVYRLGQERKGLDIAKLLNANCDKK